jgi:hypothetical protein
MEANLASGRRPGATGVASRNLDGLDESWTNVQDLEFGP